MQLNFSSICFIAKNSVLRFIEFNIFSQLWILNYVILQIKKYQKTVAKTRFNFKKRKKKTIQLTGIFIGVQADILLFTVFIFGIILDFTYLSTS